MTERENILFAIAESVLEMTDDEVIAEIKARGKDPQEIVDRMDKIFKEAVRKQKKNITKQQTFFDGQRIHQNEQFSMPGWDGNVNGRYRIDYRGCNTLQSGLDICRA